MNARQKAKHYKRLYKEMLPKTVPVVYKSVTQSHYRVCYCMDIIDDINFSNKPQQLKTYIENKIVQELKPLIWNNLKTVIDYTTGTRKYFFDIWVVKHESED